MNSPVTKEAVERVGLCASGEWRIVPGKDCPKCGATQRDECRPARLAEFAELTTLRAENAAFLAERDAAQASAREAALKEAAAACRQQMQDFFSPQYATPQPVGSLAERFACGECERAILALATPPGEKA